MITNLKIFLNKNVVPVSHAFLNNAATYYFNNNVFCFGSLDKTSKYPFY